MNKVDSFNKSLNVHLFWLYTSPEMYTVKYSHTGRLLLSGKMMDFIWYKCCAITLLDDLTILVI